MRFRMGIILATLLVAVVTAACGGGGGPSQPGGPPSGGGPTAINVDEKEWSITLAATSVKAGQITFNITNSGAIEHNFVIVQTKFEVDATQPGKSKSGTTTLKPGTYTIICNIPGHEEAGMKTTLTVTP